jgi:hypothetical protein
MWAIEKLDQINDLLEFKEWELWIENNKELYNFILQIYWLEMWNKIVLLLNNKITDNKEINDIFYAFNASVHEFDQNQPILAISEAIKKYFKISSKNFFSNLPENYNETKFEIIYNEVRKLIYKKFPDTLKNNIINSQSHVIKIVNRILPANN